MGRSGARNASLLVGALALATAGALWFGGGASYANCPPDQPDCMGGGMGSGGGSPSGGGSSCCGGSMDTSPPATTKTVTNSQSSNGGPSVQYTPQPQPQPRTQPRYTPKPKAVQPAVTGTNFLPAVPDTAPPEPPKPGPAVAVEGVEAPVPGAGTALIAGVPPAPSGGGSTSPVLPAVALLAGAALLFAPFGKTKSVPPVVAPPPPPPPPPPPVAVPTTAPATPADYYVYRSPLDNHFAVAHLGDGGVVANGYVVTYGPDTYAGCWAFVAANAVDNGPYFHAAPPPLA